MSRKRQPIVHGYGPYSRGVCRCDICRTASMLYRRAQRAKRLLIDVGHGRRAMYDAGCRCGACRVARKEATRREHQRRVAAERVFGSGKIVEPVEGVGSTRPALAPARLDRTKVLQ